MDPDPGPLPEWERDPRTGKLVPAQRVSRPSVLLIVLAAVLLLGAVVDGSILIGGIAVMVLVLAWVVPALWRRRGRARS